MKELDMRGRWFFAPEGMMECGACKGNFGGGSVERPGGSGLKGHWRNNKRCGERMEKQFWRGLREEEMTEAFRNSIGMKWIITNWKEKRSCEECKLVFKGKTPMASMSTHLRINRNCFEKAMIQVVKE